MRVRLQAILLIGVALSGGCARLCAQRLGTDTTELQKSIAAARPGETITLEDGEWRDAEITFTGCGTPEQPITLRARTPGKVVISGHSKLEIAGSYLVVEGLVFRGAYHEGNLISFRSDTTHLADHCRLTNCALLDCNNPTPGTSSTFWISLYGDHNRVDHCRTQGKTGVGPVVVVWVTDRPNEHRIDHNYLGPRPPLGVNGGETIRVGTSPVSMSVSRTVVEENYFEGCDGEVEIVSNKSCENLYRCNTFHRCAGTLTLRHGNRCVVAGNHFLGEGVRNSGGVRIIGEDHRVYNNYFGDLAGQKTRAALSMMDGIPGSPLSGYFQVKRAVVAFNTFMDCQQPFALSVAGAGTSEALSPVDSVIANNLICGAVSTAAERPAAATGLLWQGNLAAAGSGLGEFPGLRLVAVPLTAEAGGLRRPTPGSATEGAAQGDYPFVSEDIAGRPRGARKDVGCDQVGAGPAQRQPVGPTDVGPSFRLP